MADEQMRKPSEALVAVGQLFKVNKTRILSGVPRTIGGDPSRLLAIAYNSIVYGDPKLMLCTHASLLGGVMEALKMGITIGGPMQESWLVPFRNKLKGRKDSKGNWLPDEYALEATMIVGYMGLRNIIDRGRAVLDLHPRAVGHKDDFDYGFGTQPFIRHKPNGPAPLRESELRYAYAIARLRGGGVQMEVLDKMEVDQHRARSRAAKSGPWANEQDYIPMALKTAMRKLAKYVPKSSEILARALDLDEKADLGVPQDFELPEGAVLFDEQAGALGPGSSDVLDDLNNQLRQRDAVPVDRQEGR